MYTFAESMRIHLADAFHQVSPASVWAGLSQRDKVGGCILCRYCRYRWKVMRLARHCIWKMFL